MGTIVKPIVTIAHYRCAKWYAADFAERLSAMTPIADIAQTLSHVREVPLATSPVTSAWLKPEGRAPPFQQLERLDRSRAGRCLRL
jgi:hypothetical protein